MTSAQLQLLESQLKRNKMPVRLPTMMSKYLMLQLHTLLYWKIWISKPLLQFHLLFCSLRTVFASVHCWYRDSPFCGKSHYFVSCHRSDKVYRSPTMEFSFTLPAGNVIFKVHEAAVQQVFPILFISPLLPYNPCHEGNLQQAAVPATESHHTTTAVTTGCNTRDWVSPHWYSWYNRLQYQALSLTPLLQLVQQDCITRDSASTHCYSWYKRLQYHGLSLTSLLQLVQHAAVPRTQSHNTATAGTTGCSTSD